MRRAAVGQVGTARKVPAGDGLGCESAGFAVKKIASCALGAGGLRKRLNGFAGERWRVWAFRQRQSGRAAFAFARGKKRLSAFFRACHLDNQLDFCL